MQPDSQSLLPVIAVLVVVELAFVGGLHCAAPSMLLRWENGALGAAPGDAGAFLQNP